MTPDMITLLVNLGGFGVMVWLVMDMRSEAKADRTWMKELLLYMVQNQDPDFDPHELRGNPPSRTDIPIQK